LGCESAEERVVVKASDLSRLLFRVAIFGGV